MTTDIHKKIKAIIAKAESTTHPEEAETFMAMASKLLEQHGLSMAELGTINDDDPVDVTHEASKHYASETWFRLLCAQIALYYGCKIVTTQVGKNCWQHSVVGRENARVTYMLMVPFIKKQVLKAATSLINDGMVQNNSRSIAQREVGQALAVRIATLVAERQESKPSGPSGANALVPVDLIKAKLEEIFPDAKSTRRAANVRFTRAAAAEASKISLNRQTGAAKQPRLR